MKNAIKLLSFSFLFIFFLTACGNNIKINSDAEQPYLSDSILKIKKQYELLIEQSPSNAIYHYNYALLLSENVHDYNGAKKQYELALAINEKFALAQNNYARLLFLHFNDKEGARKHYLKAIEVSPEFKNEQADKLFGLEETK